MHIEQVIPQTILYSVQRNWKQKAPRKHKRSWKMKNIDVRKVKEDS